MKPNIATILSILFAVCGVLGAWSDTYIIAAVCAVLYLLFTFLPIVNEEARFILSAAAGFPILLAAGNPLFEGVIAALLLISLLAKGDALNKKTIAGSILVGIAASVCAFQSSVVVAVVIALVLVLLGVYLLFVAEYRLRKRLMVNPHDTE